MESRAASWAHPVSSSATRARAESDMGARPNIRAPLQSIPPQRLGSAEGAPKERGFHRVPRPSAMRIARTTGPKILCPTRRFAWSGRRDWRLAVRAGSRTSGLISTEGCKRLLKPGTSGGVRAVVCQKVCQALASGAAGSWSGELDDQSVSARIGRRGMTEGRLPCGFVS